MIDLHCHSNFSDGLLTPQALLDKARQQGITMLALTDHDTVLGVTALLEANTDKAIRIIQGVELSSRWKKIDIHILGLNIDHQHPVLLELIAKQREHRLTRALQMSERMALLGVEKAYDKACVVAGHQHVARPHFAQVFVNEGKARDLAAAFKRYLQRGKPAYVPTPWISIEEAVSGIKEAGGQAVLAHPLKYDLTRTKLHELVEAFKSAGGVGLEVVSGEMTPSQTQEVAGLCRRFSLLASTGSDYHGDGLSRISLGRQRALPPDCMPVWHLWMD